MTAFSSDKFLKGEAYFGGGERKVVRKRDVKKPRNCVRERERDKWFGFGFGFGLGSGLAM